MKRRTNDVRHMMQQSFITVVHSHGPTSRKRPRPIKLVQKLNLTGICIGACLHAVCTFLNNSIEAIFIDRDQYQSQS